MFLNQTKPLIDACGGDQLGGRPQRDLVIAGEANAFADKTAPDPERVCLWEPASKIGPLLPAGAIRSFSINPNMLHYRLAGTVWLFAFTRTQTTNYDLLVVSFMLPRDSRLDDR